MTNLTLGIGQLVFSLFGDFWNKNQLNHLLKIKVKGIVLGNCKNIYLFCKSMYLYRFVIINLDSKKVQFITSCSLQVLSLFPFGNKTLLLLSKILINYISIFCSSHYSYDLLIKGVSEQSNHLFLSFYS